MAVINLEVCQTWYHVNSLPNYVLCMVYSLSTNVIGNLNSSLHGLGFQQWYMKQVNEIFTKINAYNIIYFDNTICDFRHHCTTGTELLILNWIIKFISHQTLGLGPEMYSSMVTHVLFVGCRQSGKDVGNYSTSHGVITCLFK